MKSTHTRELGMVSHDERIQGEVLEAASGLGEHLVSCEVDSGEVVLLGSVSTDEHASGLEESVRAIAGVKSVQNELSVEGLEAAVENEIEGVDLSPDFTAEVGADNAFEAASEAEPYFPPTDPVVGTGGSRQDDVEILNGFAPAAGNEEASPKSDEDLLAAVEEALRMDAGTTDLDVDVMVQGGLVVLRGRVSSLDDAELAESVAASVPGVDEVREELEIEGM
jgi:osmotically-inducible protein OsmY